MSAVRCAARIGNVDDRFDRPDSETGDRAKERRCVTPKIHRAKDVGQETVQYMSNIYKYYITYKLILEESKSNN